MPLRHMLGMVFPAFSRVSSNETPAGTSNLMPLRARFTANGSPVVQFSRAEGFRMQQPLRPAKVPGLIED